MTLQCLCCETTHQSEAALTRAQVSETETAGVRRKYTGKKVPRPNRSKISTARVIDNLEVGRLREEDATEKEEKRQREAAKAARGARGTGRGRGTSGRMGRRGGVAIGAAEKVCLQC